MMLYRYINNHVYFTHIFFKNKFNIHYIQYCPGHALFPCNRHSKLNLMFRHFSYIIGKKNIVSSIK